MRWHNIEPLPLSFIVHTTTPLCLLWFCPMCFRPLPFIWTCLCLPLLINLPCLTLLSCVPTWIDLRILIGFLAFWVLRLGPFCSQFFFSTFFLKGEDFLDLGNEQCLHNQKIIYISFNKKKKNWCHFKDDVIIFFSSPQKSHKINSDIPKICKKKKKKSMLTMVKKNPSAWLMTSTTC